jgi:hypothetical protein
MKHRKIWIFCLTASLLSALAQAEPVIIETDEATIIVARPLDLWSGDKSALEDSLEAHQEKTIWYQVEFPNNRMIFGNPLLLQAATDHPIVHEVSKRITADGFTLPRNSRNSFTIRPAVIVPSENIVDLLKLQKLAYERTTLANGDPEKYQSKTSRKKFFGNVLALGATVFAAGKMGAALGTQATLGSGLTDDIYRLATQYKGGLVPINMGTTDPSKYTSFELRRVTTYAPDLTGQIFIAYKNQKTEAIENAAMVEAIVAMSGSKTSKAQIEAARTEDFKTRQSIWAECKAMDLPDCKE